MAAEFDRYAETYRDVVRDSYSIGGLEPRLFATTKARELARLVDGLARPCTQLRALDVGCGIGALHPHVAPLFGSLTGVDVSADSLAVARRSHPDLAYVGYDGTALPFADASFDVAFAVCVVHHVLPAQWPSFFAEMTRVVAPGGLVVIIEHNPLNPLTRRTVARCPFDADAVLLSHRRVTDLMSMAGLTGIATRFFPFIPVDARLARFVDDRLAWLPMGAQYCSVGRVSGP